MASSTWFKYLCTLQILVTVDLLFMTQYVKIYIQGVREWSPENFRVSLSGKMWSKTFIPFLDKLNPFLKMKLFPAVLGLLKYCFVHEKILYVSI
jgi:hypothetical protein